MLITEYDFDMLSHTSCVWDERLLGQEGRFENVTEGCDAHIFPPSGGIAYWLEGGWTVVILVKEFLSVRGYRFDVLVDLRDEDAEHNFVLVTDYRSERWRERERRGI